MLPSSGIRRSPARAGVAAAVLVGVAVSAAAAGLRPGPAQAEERVGLCGQDPSALCQGWAEHERSWWYTVTQGSRLLPLTWMLALEQADSRDKFLADGNVRRFNYIPNPASDDNPFGLPLGFAVDREEGGAAATVLCRVLGQLCEREALRERWVGLNCAACHTNELTFAGKRFRVEGAPTLADFQGFTEALLEALRATRADAAKFERFAGAVAGPSSTDRAALKAAVDEQIVWQAKLQAQSATPLRYGFGRLDAQGHILNKVALIVGAEDQLVQAADAPASYPHLWNVPQHRKLQWNGIAQNSERREILGRNTDIGALGRNTGEVIGVFAKVEVDERSALTGYASSLRLENMVAIERQLERLKPPRWPGHVLPPIDAALAAEGRGLFDAKCAGCHVRLDPDDLTTRIPERMFGLAQAQTDIWLACNAFRHRAKAGRLEGRLADGQAIKAEDATRKMLVHTVGAVILGRADELVESVFDDLVAAAAAPGREAGFAAPPEYLPGVADAEKKRQARECLTATGADARDLLRYKAGPLNGIWATAPYLHNGSVPTLYDLLLPADVRNTSAVPAADAALPRRPETFRVGGREFDPVNVGFRSDAGAGGFEFRVRDAGGAPVLGNYNAGHEGPEYGTGEFTEGQRRALVEYLKTL